MTNVTKLASVALAALVLSTAFVQAGMMNDAVSDAVETSSNGSGFPGGSGNDSDPFETITEDRNNNDSNPFDDYPFNDDEDLRPVVGFAPRTGPTIDAPRIEVGGNRNPPAIDFGIGEKQKLPIVFGNPKAGTPGKPGIGKKGADAIHVIDLAIACKVAGTPSEFPDDLVLINLGSPLAAGTTVKWKVKSAGQGYVQLAADLPTGGSAKASGVLAGGVEAGKPCTAKII
jgi:hypothetical protein